MKLGQRWLQTVPYPARNVFAGRIFEPWDFIQIVVIELIVQRRERCFYIGEIEHPPRIDARLAAHIDAHVKAVPMQARAFMAGRHIGQSVRGFEMKFFIDFGDHGAALSRQVNRARE